MLAIGSKLREFLIDHIESAQPDELGNIVEKLLTEAEPPARPSSRFTFEPSHPARLSFAERVIKLGADGRPLDRDDEPHVAVYDPLLDLTHARLDLTDEEIKQDRADKLPEEFRLFGFDDWRLPTVFELISIVDRKRHNPAVDTSLLDVKPAWYWTSEVYAPVPAGRWCVSLGSGGTGGLYCYDSAFARAVRAGQSFGPRP